MNGGTICYMCDLLSGILVGYESSKQLAILAPLASFILKSLLLHHSRLYCKVSIVRLPLRLVMKLQLDQLTFKINNPNPEPENL
jgi:hypothetical protein